MSVNSQYTHGDPEWDQFIASPPPILWSNEPDMTISSMRAKSRPSMSEPTIKTGLQVNTVQIPVQDGEISVITYVPEASSKCPLLVHFHGGGYCLSKASDDDDFCREICTARKISVVNVDYRLAPEFPFPIGFTDCFEAMKWAANHQSELNADVSKGFLIEGISAGGNFTAGLAIHARDDPSFTWKLTGQVLIIPSVCMSQVYPEKWRDELKSVEELPNAPILNARSIKVFYEAYTGQNEAHWKDVRRSPLLATSHANLPPATLHVAGHDPLRDDGILYSKVLKESGVKNKLHIYPGVPHGFWIFNPASKASNKYKQDVQEGIQWLLDGAP